MPQVTSEGQMTVVPNVFLREKHIIFVAMDALVQMIYAEDLVARRDVTAM